MKKVSLTPQQQEQFDNTMVLLNQIETRVKRLHSRDINKAYRNITADLKSCLDDFYFNEIILNNQLPMLEEAALTVIGRIAKRRKELQHAEELQHALTEIIYKSQTGPVKSFVSNYRCIVPGCGQKAIHSHTISKSNNFEINTVFYQFTDNLADHYFYPRPRKKLIAHKRASTFPLFCLHHDTNLFSSIEMNNNIDFNNPNHHLLQNWRTFSFREVQVNYHYNEIKHILKRNTKSFSIRNIPEISPDNSFDYDFFHAKTMENKPILYLAIALEKAPNILASFCDDLRYIEKNGVYEKEELFYLHLLKNREKPCLILSGFDSINMRNALAPLKDLFLNDEGAFWQEIFKMLILNDNVFFEEKLFSDSILHDKMETIFNQIHMEWNNPKINYSIKAHKTISKKEACKLFQSKKMFTNIPEALDNPIRNYDVVYDTSELPFKRCEL